MRYESLLLVILCGGCMSIGAPEEALPKGANSIGLVRYEAQTSGIIPGTSARIVGCYANKEGASALKGEGTLVMELDGCKATYGTK